MVKRRIAFIALATAIFVATVLLVIRNYGRNQVYTRGQLVSVTVQQVPVPPGRPKARFDFALGGKTYVKYIDKENIKALTPGDTIQLKSLNGYEKYSLFPDEKPATVELFLPVVFFIFGGVCVFKAIKAG